MKKINIHPFIYFFVSIIYLEIITKLTVAKHFFNSGLIYMIVFTIPFVLAFTILSKIFNKTINKITMLLSMLVITIYFEVQYIFFNLFSVPFSFSTIGLADQALDFTIIIKDTIVSHAFVFILILLPFILGLVFSKFIDNSSYHKESIITLFVMLITSYLSTYLLLIPFPFSDNAKEASDLYWYVDDSISIIDRFGLLTYIKIDIRRQLIGSDTKLVDEGLLIQPSESEIEDIDYGFNEIDIDFEKLSSKKKDITTLNSYISKQQATSKSEYTGMFKGKNLIFILAEGFNEIAVDQDRTPTLYKLTNSGFVFSNFYSPVFLSTTGGEFQATTGLMPTQEILNNWKSKQPTISYALGNSFSNIGYKVQSYHDWTYTYYKRNLTMKTLGFSNYTGCGNGLEKRMECPWLPYDSEMIEVTYEDYMNEDNFVTYYVTVSGHSPYEAGDNIAQHYYENVQDLDYSIHVKYYLAAQMELDKMLETLIAKLEETGRLEDTVIALVGDHYPYTLSIDEMNEASSYKKDGIIEVNRSNFILWNSEIEEPIIVDKVGSQIDVLPTLLNLFGIEYDSRLIVGKDILSDSDGIAIFSNRSWVTDYGSYDSLKKKFTLKDGKSLEDESAYIKSINNKVANYFSVSKLIIDNDYYTYVLGSE